MRNIYTSILLICLSVFTLSAQNEFVNDGGAVYIENGAELYVHGEVKLNSGSTLDNAGLIQMDGSTANPNGVNWISDASTLSGSGKVRFYESPGSGASYNISGSNVVFNNLALDIEQVVGGINVQFVSLNNNIQVNGVLELNDGRIVTGSNEVFVNNSNANAIVSTANFGDNESNYVEGRLKRAIVSGNNYQFPIGSSNKGFNRADLNIRTATASAIVGEFKESNNVGWIYYRDGDIDCSANPNGIQTQHFDINGMVEDFGYWSFQPDGASTGWDYDMDAYPNKTELLSTNPGAVYFKMLKAPNGFAGVNQDWTPHVSNSGDLCAGVNVVGSNLVNPYQGYANVDDVEAKNLTSFSDFALSKSSSTGLPIELVSLEANPVDNEFIRVDWVTSTEINNAGFEVQRSTDGINFKEIGWVDGAGNSTDELEYAFNDYDVEPNKTYYYRLKQIDYDGEFEITYIVNAMITQEGILTVGNFVPNPTNGTSTIQVNSSEVHKIRVQIFTTLGQVVNIKDYEINPGLNTMNFDFSMLADGTYHAVIVVDENEVHNKKIVITK